MNKQELIKEIANNVGLSKTQATQALNSVVDGITKSLMRGESVKFVKFGSFQVTQRKARKGRNPKTGKEIDIAAKSVAKFRPGTGLRASLRG